MGFGDVQRRLTSRRAIADCWQNAKRKAGGQNKSLFTLDYQVHGTTAEPIVFIPDLNVATLEVPSIIDDF